MNRRSVGLIVNILMLGVAAIAYPHLPAQVPTHWDMHGNVNGTMPRFPGAFLASLIAIALWFLMPLLRRIDPRRSSYERFDATFYLIVNIMAVMLALIEGLTLAVSLGVDVNMTRTILFVVGLMLVVLGNYLPRIRSNWWIGIRTPWTLESEEVWRKTHRFGGRTFVAAGVVTILSTPLPQEVSSVVSIVAMVTAGLVPAVYSYVAYRGEQKRHA